MGAFGGLGGCSERREDDPVLGLLRLHEEALQEPWDATGVLQGVLRVPHRPPCFPIEPPLLSVQLIHNDLHGDRHGEIWWDLGGPPFTDEQASEDLHGAWSNYSSLVAQGGASGGLALTGAA